jgi:hypothetical protein
VEADKDSFEVTADGKAWDKNRIYDADRMIDDIIRAMEQRPR